MLQKIKNWIKLNFKHLEKISASQDELVWAEVYHDTIRGRKFIEDLSLSPGRWAGGYSFFYVLTRILIDYRPARILEMGLGESSKFITVFLENELKDSIHHVVEHDANWVEIFSNKNQVCSRTDIRLCDMVMNTKGAHSYRSYDKFSEVILPKYDLYLVDGPIGSPNFSRYDILKALEHMEQGDEFVLILDDYNRLGEQQTGADLFAMLNAKQIKFYHEIYKGSKYQLVLATEKYRWVCSL